MSDRRAVALQWPAVEKGKEDAAIGWGHSEVKEGLEF